MLISLYPATRASTLILKRLPFSARYKHGSGGGQATHEERAPSMEEEFKRVAEEKSRQGVSSQTVEKARDGAEEATIGSAKLEHVKEAYQEPPGRGDFRRKE